MEALFKARAGVHSPSNSKGPVGSCSSHYWQVRPPKIPTSNPPRAWFALAWPFASGSCFSAPESSQSSRTPGFGWTAHADARWNVYTACRALHHVPQILHANTPYAAATSRDLGSRLWDALPQLLWKQRKPELVDIPAPGKHNSSGQR